MFISRFSIALRFHQHAAYYFRNYVSKSTQFAVPFMLNEKDAKKKIDSFFKQNSLTFNKALLLDVTIRPIYVPTYVFQGSLNVNFDGEIGKINKQISASFNGD